MGTEKKNQSLPSWRFKRKNDNVKMYFYHYEHSLQVSENFYRKQVAARCDIHGTYLEEQYVL
jgi:hypothetical protein